MFKCQNFFRSQVSQNSPGILSRALDYITMKILGRDPSDRIVFYHSPPTEHWFRWPFTGESTCVGVRGFTGDIPAHHRSKKYKKKLIEEGQKNSFPLPTLPFLQGDTAQHQDRPLWLIISPTGASRPWWVSACLPLPCGVLPERPLLSHLMQNAEVTGMAKGFRDNRSTATRAQDSSKVWKPY